MRLLLSWHDITVLELLVRCCTSQLIVSTIQTQNTMTNYEDNAKTAYGNRKISSAVAPRMGHWVPRLLAPEKQDQPSWSADVVSFKSTTHLLSYNGVHTQCGLHGSFIRSLFVRWIEAVHVLVKLAFPRNALASDTWCLPNSNSKSNH